MSWCFCGCKVFARSLEQLNTFLSKFLLLIWHVYMCPIYGDSTRPVAPGCINAKTYKQALC